MKKTLGATLKSGIHFEQIPLEEVVKKIADNLTLEPPSKKTEPYSMPAGSLRLVASGSGPNQNGSRR